MKKKYLAILMATMMTATILFSVPATISEEEEQEVGEWEKIYQMDINSIEESKDSKDTYPDLQVYSIWKQHYILGNNWKIKYYIYCTKEFTGTFTDEVWLDDDVDWWFIDDITHNDELMWRGINGPYYTKVFPAPYKGWFDMNVFLDIDDDITESNEGNNHDYATAYFWWL